MTVPHSSRLWLYFANGAPGGGGGGYNLSIFSDVVLVIEIEADDALLLATLKLCEAIHEGEVLVTISMLVHGEGVENLANAGRASNA
jgi:hypothetical protein